MSFLDFTASRLHGEGFHVPTDIGRMSDNFAAMARDRRDAIKAMSGGARRIMHAGHRVDSESLPAGAMQRELALLAMEHAAAGSPLSGGDGLRLDSAIPMASQALVSIYKQVFEIEHSELAAWSGKILAIDSQVDPAAQQAVWYESDIAGAPRAASTYDLTSIPMVNGPVASQNVIGIVPALVGWETNFMEQRYAKLAKQNNKPDFMLDARKIETCKMVIAQFFNALWLYGDPSRGIDGLHTSPVVGSITAPSGPWSGLSDAQIRDELTKMLFWITDRTNGRLGDIKRVQIQLPPSQFNRIHQPTFVPGGFVGVSIWESFAKANGLSDDQCIKVYEYASANSEVYTGGPSGLAADRAYVVYKKGDMWDPCFIYSQKIEIPAAPRMTGLGEVTYMHARGGGVRIADAQRVFAYDGL